MISFKWDGVIVWRLLRHASCHSLRPGPLCSCFPLPLADEWTTSRRACHHHVGPVATEIFIQIAIYNNFRQQSVSSVCCSSKCIFIVS